MNEVLSPFPCNACGKCCRLVSLSEQTAFLDRGDGVCRHFDETDNLCRVYHQRPLVCNVEQYYRIHIYPKMDWGEFVSLNQEVCHCPLPLNWDRHN